MEFFERHSQEKVESSMKTLTDAQLINATEAKREAKQYRTEITHLLNKHLDGKTIIFYTKKFMFK